MSLEDHARKIMGKRLSQLGLTKKNNYTADEVQKILRLKKSSLSRRLTLYEKPSAYKNPSIPPLKSQKVTGRRYVNYWDLVAYIAKEEGLNIWSEEKYRPRKQFVEKAYPGAQPCPFCGNDKISPGKLKSGFSLLYCQGCKTCGPVAATLGEALSLWNLRK